MEYEGLERYVVSKRSHEELEKAKKKTKLGVTDQIITGLGLMPLKEKAFPYLKKAWEDAPASRLGVGDYGGLKYPTGVMKGLEHGAKLAQEQFSTEEGFTGFVGGTMKLNDLFSLSSMVRPAAGKANKVMTLDELRPLADPNVPLAKMRHQERGYLDNLKKKIASEGMQEPLEIRNGMIYDGAHRLAVLEELGIENIPVKIIK